MPDQTIEDLGKLVKAKYPDAYGSLSDVEIGRRVKAKYPEYSQFKDISTVPGTELTGLPPGPDLKYKGKGPGRWGKPGEMQKSILSTEGAEHPTEAQARGRLKELPGEALGAMAGGAFTGRIAPPSPFALAGGVAGGVGGKKLSETLNFGPVGTALTEFVGGVLGSGVGATAEALPRILSRARGNPQAMEALYELPIMGKFVKSANMFRKALGYGPIEPRKVPPPGMPFPTVSKGPQGQVPGKGPEPPGVTFRPETPEAPTKTYPAPRVTMRPDIPEPPTKTKAAPPLGRMRSAEAEVPPVPGTEGAKTKTPDASGPSTTQTPSFSHAKTLAENLNFAKIPWSDAQNMTPAEWIKAARMSHLDVDPTPETISEALRELKALEHAEAPTGQRAGSPKLKVNLPSARKGL